VALLRDGQAVEQLNPGEQGEVILAVTPFYAESGGQVGDAGVLQAEGIRFVVSDTQKRGSAQAHSHIGQLSLDSRALCVGMPLRAEIDQRLRQAIALNHSATHLLHAALREAERTANELRAIGVANQCLIVNGSFATDCPEDPIAQAMQQRGQSALTAARAFIESMPSFIVPLRPINILGIAGLRQLLSQEPLGSCLTAAASDWTAPALESLEDLVTSIEQQGHGVIMTMGKGGVGKTTVAAAIAVMLAKRGHSVHLSTTDPAAHLAQTLDGQVAGLSVSKIDPAAETAAYQTEVIQQQGAAMDEAGRALLEEDLRSPCTEEIAVFRAFAREVGKGTGRFVVLDTAPTGHTLLLLDASEAYQRELERQTQSSQPEEVLKLLERLRDPDFTHILLVTLPEATPVHEAAALQEDLRRARIEPYAWVINQSLLHSGSCDPLLQCRERSEHRYLQEIVEKQSQRTAWLPWQAQEPIGPAALAQLGATTIAELESA
jgi:arsenite-transporting ATPase